MARPISEVVDLSEAVDEPGPRFREVLDAIDAIHRVRDDVPPVPVVIDPALLYPAWYEAQPNGDVTRIAIHPSCSDPCSTLLHELGHYVDHAVIKPPGNWSSPTEPFASWYAAVTATDAVAALEGLRNRPPLPELAKTFDYYLRVEELFARSYCQWVTLRSGNELLNDELSDILARLNYPAQWGHDDFAPVANALDDLLKGPEWNL